MRLSRMLPCLLIVILGLTSPAFAAEPLLSDIQFKKVSADHESIIFQLNGFYPPTVFGIEGDRPRVVCDFNNVRVKRSVQHLIETQGDFARLIRIGIHKSPNKKVRAVLDLDSNYNYFIEQTFFKKNNIYTIDIKSLSENQKKGVQVESLSDQ